MDIEEIEPEEGRRVRRAMVSDIFVRDWDSFRAAWKPTDFIKGWNDLNNEEINAEIKKKLLELYEDEKKLCYLFPDSLKKTYHDAFLEIVASNQFNEYLDWEYEALFMGQKKQLIIYRKRTSISQYLSKYRLCKKHKELFQDISSLYEEYQSLIIERNLAISHDESDEQIQQRTVALSEFEKGKWSKSKAKYFKLVNDALQDFVSQPKKYEVPFPGVNSYLATEIRKLAQSKGLFISNRFRAVSEHDEYKDIIVTKEDLSSADPSFDDEPISDEEFSSEEQGVQVENQKVLKIDPPKDLESVRILRLNEDGVVCQINLFGFGARNAPETLEIEQLAPRDTEEQKSFHLQVSIQNRDKQYEAVLPILNEGYACYSVRAVNEQGKSKAKILQVWHNVDPNQKPLKRRQRNRPIYIMGQNSDGVIPNWDQKDDGIIYTTNEKWEKLKMTCETFSMSSHIAVCSSKGDVACWGKMYSFNDTEVTQENDLQAPEDALLEMAYLRPDCYRIEKPSLILSDHFIRRVSCGEGYCLMADCYGQAWGFGTNSLAQLGFGHNNNDSDTEEPAVIEYFRSESVFVTEVWASSFGASFAVDHKGGAYRWGANQVEKTDWPIKDNYNNVINYETFEIAIIQFAPIPFSKNVLSDRVACIYPGKDFVLLLTTDHSLYGWGKCNMLGKGVMKSAHFEEINSVCNPVPIMDEVSQVAVGPKHCLALRGSELVGWGDGKNLKAESKGWVNSPQIVRSDFKGQFACGEDFTALVVGEELEIVGCRKVFKEGRYKLPGTVSKIVGGKGTIMVME